MLGVPRENLIRPLFKDQLYDYWTGAHGNLWKVSKDISLDDHGNAIQHVEDMWDVNPFQRDRDKIGLKLTQRVNKVKSK